MEPAVLDVRQRWEEQRGDAFLDGSAVGARPVSHHEGVSGPDAERAQSPVEHAWVRLLEPLFKRERVDLDGVADPGRGECRPHVEVDVAENRYLDTPPSQLEHGADRVGGERVVARVRLDDVQGVGQVVVASSVVEHLEVGPPVVSRVRINARTFKAVLHAPRGADRRHQSIDVVGIGASTEKLQCLQDPLVLGQGGDEGASPIEDDGAESHGTGVSRQPVRVARGGESARTTQPDRARRELRPQRLTTGK